jgi:hypothetical protein
MSDAVTIIVCKTDDDRDKAVGFLRAQQFLKITVEQGTDVNYDRSKKFYDPPGLVDAATGFVVIGVK